MSKFSEAYNSRYYDEQPKLPPKKQGKPRARNKRETKQVESRSSFIVDGSSSSWQDNGLLSRQAQFREDSLAYYDAFHDMLHRYGKFNIVFCLLESLKSEFPSSEALNTLQYHYGGDIDNVEHAVERARYWLRQACYRFGRAAERVDLFDVDARYNEDYCDCDRRDEYYTFIKRERHKIALGKSVALFTPSDFEDNYQRNRAIAAARAEKKTAKKATAS